MKHITSSLIIIICAWSSFTHASVIDREFCLKFTSSASSAVTTHTFSYNVVNGRAVIYGESCYDLPSSPTGHECSFTQGGGGLDQTGENLDFTLNGHEWLPQFSNAFVNNLTAVKLNLGTQTGIYKTLVTAHDDTSVNQTELSDLGTVVAIPCAKNDLNRDRNFNNAIRILDTK